MTPEAEDGAAWLRRAGELLARGVRDRHSNWRTFALATCDADGPAVRSVALRGFERESATVEFWTDRRSAKVASFGNGAAAMFWDPRSHIQLRLSGRIETADASDPAVANVARGLSDEALLNYATLAPPGAVADHDDPDERGGRAFAMENLLACRLVPASGDLVHLGLHRHRRFAYRFDPFDWTAVVP